MIFVREDIYDWLSPLLAPCNTLQDLLSKGILRITLYAYVQYTYTNADKSILICSSGTWDGLAALVGWKLAFSRGVHPGFALLARRDSCMVCATCSRMRLIEQPPFCCVRRRLGRHIGRSTRLSSPPFRCCAHKDVRHGIMHRRSVNNWWTRIPSILVTSSSEGSCVFHTHRLLCPFRASPVPLPQTNITRMPRKGKRSRKPAIPDVVDILSLSLFFFWPY